jgi:hypothetical protein
MSIVQNSFIKDQLNSKDGKLYMLRQGFHHFLDSIIREHAEVSEDGYSLSAHLLPYEDKKLFLTYLVVPEDYEYLTENPLRERLAILDHEPAMQYMINDRIDDLYHEDMRELSEKHDEE